MAYPTSKHIHRFLGLASAAVAAIPLLGAGPQPDYLSVVRAYADCLIEHGRAKRPAIGESAL